MIKFLATSAFKQLEAERNLLCVENKELIDIVYEQEQRLSDTQTQAESSHEQLSRLTAKCELVNASHTKLLEDHNALQVAYDKLKLEALSPIADETHVVISIKDDLTTISPTIRYDPVIVPKLIELGYINDAAVEKNDAFAIQIALISIVHEGLGQIMESFTE